MSRLPAWAIGFSVLGGEPVAESGTYLDRWLLSSLALFLRYRQLSTTAQLYQS